MKKNQMEIHGLKKYKKSTITKMRLNNGFEMTEETISKLEDRSMEIMESEEQRAKRMKKNEESLREIWDISKCNNIHVMGVPEGEEKGKEKYLKY